MSKLYNYINKLNFSFWSRIVNNTSTNVKSLCVFRILSGCFLLFFYCPTFGWLGGVPQSFFDPPIFSIAIFFNGFLSQGVFYVIDAILLLFILFIILGIKAGLSSRLYCILSVFALSFQNSFGEIDHFIMIYAALFILSFSGWGSDLALVPDEVSQNDAVSKSLSVIAVVLCFAYFTSGHSKATQWINFDFNKNGLGSWYFHGFYSLSRHYLLAPYVKLLPFWVFKLMDFSAVAFELSPILFLLYSFRSWRLFLLIAVVFHLIILLILNISFIPHVVVYLAFVDFSGWYPRIVNLLKLALTRWVVGIVLVVVTVIRVFYMFDIEQYLTLFVAAPEILKTGIVGICIFIVSAGLLFNSFNKGKEPATQQLEV